MATPPRPLSLAHSKPATSDTGHANSGVACCPNGHPRTLENTTLKKGGGGREYLSCRVCTRAAGRRSYRRKVLGIKPGNDSENLVHALYEEALKAVNKTCVNGHPWTPDTERVNSKGTKFCRTCETEAERRRARKRRQCGNGHRRTPENTRISDKGWPVCLTCAANRKKRATEKKRKEDALKRPKRTRATHCRNGHARTPDNTLIRGNGHRRCKDCRAESIARCSADQKTIT